MSPSLRSPSRTNEGRAALSLSTTIEIAVEHVLSRFLRTNSRKGTRGTAGSSWESGSIPAFQPLKRGTVTSQIRGSDRSLDELSSRWQVSKNDCSSGMLSLITAYPAWIKGSARCSDALSIDERNHPRLENGPHHDRSGVILSRMADTDRMRWDAAEWFCLGKY